VLRWDPSTGALIGTPLIGHTGAVVALALSPDGTKLASGSLDGTVRLWDLSSGGSGVAVLPGSTGNVAAMAFSPDGTRFFTAGKDGVVRVWDRLWNAGEACRLAAPYLSRSQVKAYMPSGYEPKCRYPA